MKIKSLYNIILTGLILTSCETNYVDYHSKIITEKGEFNYALYLDGVGIGDPGYTVLKLEKNINPEDLYIKWSLSEGINYKANHEKIEWFRDRKVLFNYAEAGYHTSNPKIELINDRYVVFSRGGYFYGLYDILLEKDTFNIGSPWHEWRSNSDYESERYNKEKENLLYEEWIKHNIHKRIRSYIENN